MTRPNPAHPAPYSAAVLEVFQSLIDREGGRLGHSPSVIDVMAGVGRIHSLQRCTTVGVELEPEWAACHHLTEVGDALALRFEDGSFDAVMVSPVYPNRMTDHHDAQDTHKACAGQGCNACAGTGLSPRKTYRAQLGRMPSEGSSATMGWGEPYREFCKAQIAEMHRVVRPGGLVAVNMSNHIRAERVVPVVEWWIGALADGGLFLEAAFAVKTPRMRKGQNYAARVPYEHVICTRR